MRIAFALAAALLATPAFADGEPVATAAKSSAPMTTAEQIDAYLATSPALDAKALGEVDGVTPREDRRVHGVVSVGVGTGGYRSVYLETDMPVGENGRVRLAFEDTRGDRSYARHGFPGAGPLAGRQRCDLEGLTPPRPLDVAGGPHGRCVGGIPGW